MSVWDVRGVCYRFVKGYSKGVLKDKLKVSVVKELLLLLFPKTRNKIFVIGYIFPRKDHLFPVQTNYLKNIYISR